MKCCERVPTKGARMKFDVRPGAGVKHVVHLRSSAKSLLSIFLSIAFVFPTEIGWPARAVAAVPAPEDGHGSAVPLHDRLGSVPTPAKNKKPKQDPVLKGLPITELSADEAILHALNRLAYGPRPGDMERVRQMGLAKWIEQQLNPNSVDDRALDARLADYPTLRMSTAELIDEYPQPKPAEKQAEKQAQARAQQEQRRSDAAAEVGERDMQTGQGQPANSEAPPASSASVPQPPPANP